jgi:hypothetical protein
MEAYKINLEEYRTPGSKVFTGRDRGIEVRQASKIDSLEPCHQKIEILVPADIRSINPSFLEEFLFNVVCRLRVDGFNAKFRFITPGRYDIQSDLEEAVERILREENALA